MTACQHCYRDLNTEEYICYHCKIRGIPDMICQGCDETIHEYHEDDGFIEHCYACYWEATH